MVAKIPALAVIIGVVAGVIGCCSYSLSNTTSYEKAGKMCKKLLLSLQNCRYLRYLRWLFSGENTLRVRLFLPLILYCFRTILLKCWHVS